MTLKRREIEATKYSESKRVSHMKSVHGIEKEACFLVVFVYLGYCELRLWVQFEFRNCKKSQRSLSIPFQLSFEVVYFKIRFIFLACIFVFFSCCFAFEVSSSLIFNIFLIKISNKHPPLQVNFVGKISHMFILALYSQDYCLWNNSIGCSLSN